MSQITSTTPRIRSQISPDLFASASRVRRVRVWAPSDAEICGPLWNGIACTLSSAFSSREWVRAPMPIGDAADPHSAAGIMSALFDKGPLIVATMDDEREQSQCVLGCVLGGTLDESLIEDYGLAPYGAQPGDAILAYIGVAPSVQGLRGRVRNEEHFEVPARATGAREDSKSLASFLFERWLRHPSVARCPSVFVRTRETIEPILHLAEKNGFAFQGQFELDFRGERQNRLVFRRDQAHRAKHNRRSSRSDDSAMPDGFYLRDPKLTVLTSDREVILVREDSTTFRFATEHVREWSQLMQRLCNPVSEEELSRWRVETRTDDLVWARLIDEGYLHHSQREAALFAQRDRAFSENQGFDFSPAKKKCEHLIIACTGSVVAGLVAPTVLSLHYSGFQANLDVILTESALKFVTRELFEAYGIRTWVGASERSDAIHVPHVQLGRSTDCILVMPATARTLQKIASAECSDLLSLTIAASRAPVVLAPAMNETMWNHPGVQRNVQQIREDGMYIVEPTLIFGAADVASHGAPMFGGHGVLWGGPRSLKHVLSAVLATETRAPGGRNANGVSKCLPVSVGQGA